jgi:hypothetical protein
MEMQCGFKTGKRFTKSLLDNMVSFDYPILSY